MGYNCVGQMCDIFVASVIIFDNFVKGLDAKWVNCDKYCIAHGCATRKNSVFFVKNSAFYGKNSK